MKAINKMLQVLELAGSASESEMARISLVARGVFVDQVKPRRIRSVNALRLRWRYFCPGEQHRSASRVRDSLIRRRKI